MAEKKDRTEQEVNELLDRLLEVAARRRSWVAAGSWTSSRSG